MRGPMRVAVTGSTGFVGRYVVRELLRRGHTVRALARDMSRARAALPADDQRLRIVVGDRLDETTATRLVDGVDACVHLIGIIREGPAGQSFRRVHVETTATMLRACQACAVLRFVHMSALGVGPEGRCDYQRTKFEAERLVRESGLAWTIFRPGIIHGPESGLMQMARGWVRGRAAPWLFLPYFVRAVRDDRVPFGPVQREDPVVQPIAVEDVAWCFAESLERETSEGEIYNLTGPEVMTMPDLLRAIRDAVPGANPDLEPRGIPAGLAAAVARAARWLGTGALLPFDEGMALMGAEDSTASPAKACAHLGLQPRPFVATLRTYAAGM